MPIEPFADLSKTLGAAGVSFLGEEDLKNLQKVDRATGQATQEAYAETAERASTYTAKFFTDLNTIDNVTVIYTHQTIGRLFKQATDLNLTGNVKSHLPAIVGNAAETLMDHKISGNGHGRAAILCVYMLTASVRHKLKVPVSTIWAHVAIAAGEEGDAVFSRLNVSLINCVKENLEPVTEAEANTELDRALVGVQRLQEMRTNWAKMRGKSRLEWRREVMANTAYENLTTAQKTEIKDWGRRNQVFALLSNLHSADIAIKTLYTKPT